MDDKMIALGAELTDNPENADVELYRDDNGYNADDGDVYVDKDIKAEKQGRIAKLKTFLFNRNGEKAFKKETKLAARTAKHKARYSTGEDGFEDGFYDKTAKHTRQSKKLNDYLDAIECQLDKMDEQNKMLLFYLTTVKENNEALLNQVNLLSKHNDELYKQFQASKKREKIAKILAIISSVAAIGFTVWRIIDAFLSARGG